MSNFSYTLDELQPLTPEQLAAINPELLRDLPVLAPEPARFLGPNEMAEPPEDDSTEDDKKKKRRTTTPPEDDSTEDDKKKKRPTEPEPEPSVEDPAIATLRARLAELEAAKDNESARRKNDARSTIAKVLKTYGLDSLSEYLYGIIASDEINLNNPDAIIFSIRERPEYQTRFAANKARIGKGLPELDPGTYVALEEQYRATLQANGMPKDFYDKSDDFTAWIEGDVSPAEIQSRIVEGFRAVDDADPEVKRQMTRLYGVNQADLAAYFLDPKRAEPILKTKQLIRQAQAAQVAARAKEQGFMDIAAATAEEIVSRGITAQQAQEGFGRMTELAGLYTEMGTEEALSETEKIGAALGFDEAATRKLQTRVATRKAAFRGGGGFTSTRGATSGTTETGLGGPQ
jgi:hypothetical protein